MVCDTLVKCVTFGMSRGLASGGFGDFMLEQSWYNKWAMPMWIFELLLHLSLLLLLGGVMSALILMAVKQYHSSDNSKHRLRSVCFICGASRLNFATQVTYLGCVCMSCT